MAENLLGYRGEVRKMLSKIKVKIGDIITATSNGKSFKGILMPRYELADDKHVVLKLDSGYNIGIRVTRNMDLKKVGEGTTPTFKMAKTPKEKKGLPAIAIISTGGTIASRVDYRSGAVHSALSASELYSIFPELAEIANIHTDILFSLFSENIFARHWEELALCVAKHINAGVDGVVVCHGTDTMGYTSAALSFALQNLAVPVILVGSQRSSDRPSSDAAQNLINAVKAAAISPVAEVMVCMHETTSDRSVILHRGTKVRKCHTSRRDAFKSVNSTPLLRIVGEQIEVLSDFYMKRSSDKRLVLNPSFEEKVALIKFYPGLEPDMIKWHVNNSFRGIILEGTGLGHIAEHLISEIKKAIEHGLVVGMTSQCIWGRINMNVYSTGMDLQEVGVIPLGDMLADTALVKMMWAFKQTKDVHKVKELMITNIVGEIHDRSVFGEFP